MHTPNSEQLWTIDLAAALGYDFVNDNHTTSVDLTKYVLPPRPFTVIGPLVIIRELILDNNGHTTRNILGRERSRYLIRRLPTNTQPAT